MSKLLTFGACIIKCIIIPLIFLVRFLSMIYIHMLYMHTFDLAITFKSRCSRCIPHSCPPLVYFMPLFLAIKIVTNKIRFNIFHTMFASRNICSMTKFPTLIACDLSFDFAFLSSPFLDDSLCLVDDCYFICNNLEVMSDDLHDLISS